jgi:cytochrome c peroxidase
MRTSLYQLVLVLSLAWLVSCTLDDSTDFDESESSRTRLTPEQVRNDQGIGETYSLLGPIRDVMATNSFFKNMGTTGRTCQSCHGQAGGWTTSAAQQLWDDSHGNDPLFMFTHDNGLCPDSDISTKTKRRAAMLLTRERGSTRGSQRAIAGAEFEITAVDDPYHCSGTVATGPFFTYRKPNPSFAVSKKTSVTWAPAPQPDMPGALRNFLVGATQNHGLTTYVPTAEEQQQAADFMLNTFFAQIIDDRAGRLDDDGALGGPVHLSEQEWFVGINHASTGATTRRVFTLFDAWRDLDPRHCRNDRERRKVQARRLIAEGQDIFNERVNANGGTCSGCHNSPNVGTRSVYQLFDIGAVDIPDPGLPSVHLRNLTTGEERVVNNLGRAAATGLWSDVGKMAVPILRGLSQRAPYFNSGQAKTLRDVVNHYDQRFQFNFTSHERDALVAFLAAL